MMGSMPLPPGPSEPAAIQMSEWIVRPTALLRRCHARYGEPFTLRIGWSDAPMVLVSDPGDIKRIFAADPSVLEGGASSSVLEPGFSFWALLPSLFGTCTLIAVCLLFAAYGSGYLAQIETR